MGRQRGSEADSQARGQLGNPLNHSQAPGRKTYSLDLHLVLGAREQRGEKSPKVASGETKTRTKIHTYPILDGDVIILNKVLLD